MKKQTLTNCHFKISEFEQVKEKVLNWAKRFNTFCFLDNHHYTIQPHTIECVLAAGARRSISANAGNGLATLQDFLDEHTGWVFGHLGYDLKNELEKLYSTHPTGLAFPDLYFFEPEILVRLTHDELVIDAFEPAEIFDQIEKMELFPGKPVKEDSPVITIQNRLTREEYISILHKLKEHILRGDCYEINYCMEFFSEHVVIDPVEVYKGLSRLSPNPFSALYRVEDQWLICASPERFITKKGDHILSQPIKGTLKRNGGDDAESRKALFESEKDRSENVMIVDLVRNDLSRICRDGTVKVEELFGIYAFPQVYQMISTIGGILKENISFTDIIRATFPMGSMTGAPKKKVMELIEKYERTRRGIFSGAVGYIDPSGDFDLNVVIRSIMYNASTGYLSFQAGSGITFYSEPEKEWEECLLKATAIREVLSGF